MKNRLLTAALALCLAVGCANPAGGGNSAGGSVGVSADDSLVFAADGDLDKVFVYDTRLEQVVSAISVGRQPEKVLVAPDDTVYVTNRYSRSVSVIRRGESTESARLATAVEPVGLALTEDGKTLYVVNATSLTDADFGTVRAFDTATLSLKWETPVGEEPRGITLMAGGKLAVSLYKQGDLVFLDASSGKVLKAGTRLFEKLNGVALGIVGQTGGGVSVPVPDMGSFGSNTSHARGLEALTVSPSGEQLYATSLLATDVQVMTTGTGDDEFFPELGGGGYGGVSSCGATAIASPALLTFNAEGQPLVDDLSTCTGEAAGERPMTVLTSPRFEVPLQGARAMAVDHSGRFLYVVHESSDNVAVVRVGPDVAAESDGPGVPRCFNCGGFGFNGDNRGTEEVVAVGAGPSGIALSSDGARAWVYNSFDHTLSTLGGKDGSVRVVATTRLNAGLPVEQQERLSPDAQAGRRLFFSATDARMNALTTGISCQACHLEGREDGHVWNFSEGPRQTPSLAGRKMMQTAPFHWNGEFAGLNELMSHVVVQRMGGSGVDETMDRQVAAYIDSLEAPENPHLESVPAEVVARGREVFEAAACGTCHGGEAFTDNSFADVGTYVTNKVINDDLSMLPFGGLNAPSLLGLARTAPYLHDGSATSLKARIINGKQTNRRWPAPRTRSPSPRR